MILSEIDRTGTLRIGKFYSRRVRRLLPAAVAVVVATCAVFVLISSVTRRLPLIGDAQAALLYVANWRLAAAPHGETSVTVLFRDRDLSRWGARYSPD